MGWDIWIHGFIWVFFLYGLLIFIRMIFYRSPWFKNKNGSPLIIVVHNGEEYIEGLLRDLAVQGFEIDVVDKKSTDATRSIIERLSHELDNIHLIDGYCWKVEVELAKDFQG